MFTCGGLNGVPRCFKSSVIIRGGGDLCSGANFLRNFRLRNVVRPDPSTLITYWSNCRTSVTFPVLSHFVGLGPVWFWIRTWSPTVRGGSLFVCSDHFSSSRRCRTRSASSRAESMSDQDEWGSYLPGRMGMKSRTGLPNTHIAGDTLVMGSGVLRCCRTALWNLSTSRSPLGPVLDVINRLADFTPISARLLECGNATEDFRWWTPQSCKNF